MLASLGVPDRNLYGTTAEKLEPLDMLGGRSARYALQRLGTEWGRECMDVNFWVRAWEHALDAECDTDDIIVADDVRFHTEAEAIDKRGGLLLCIVRSTQDFGRIPQHASEDFGALPFDELIINGGSLFGLERSIDVVLDKLPQFANCRA